MNEKTINSINFLKGMKYETIKCFTRCMKKNVVTEMAEYLGCENNYDAVAHAIVISDMRDKALAA